MARNGSGTYVLPAGQPVVTGTSISSTTFNTLTNDLANALTQSISSDGQTTPTANLPMGGYKHTNVANGSARSDYAALGQLQDSAGTYLSSVAGTDTYTASMSAPTLTAYAAGQVFQFVVPNTNTGAATLNINSLGAKSITKNGTTALVASDLVAGAVAAVAYDGTRFQLLNPGTAIAPAPSPAAPGAFTTLSASSTVSGQGFIDYFKTPPALGGTTPAAGAFTTLSASSTVSGAGFSTYLASPPAIGGTAAAAGSFTTLAASSTVSGTGFSNYLASPPAIGGTTASTIRGTTITATSGFSGGSGSFTTLSASSTVSGTGFSNYLASPPAIGGTAAAAGSFTTLSATTNLAVATDVLWADSTNGLVRVGTTGGGTALRFVVNGHTTDGTSTAIRANDSAGTVLWYVGCDGQFVTSSTKTGAPYQSTTATAANLVVSAAGVFQRSTSSIKYKRDVENFAPGLSETLQLRPVTYKGKNPADGETVFGGLIAEEVDAIQGLQPFVVRAPDGTPDGLAYGNMVALLVNAIKEQNALIQALTARVAALEGA